MPRSPFRLSIAHLEDRSTPTVTTAFDALTGRLVVTSSAGDVMTVTTAGPAGSQVVAVNGKKLTVAVGAVQTLQVRGGPGNNTINLAAVMPAKFPALTTVLVDAGAGRDAVTGSAFADDLLGGPDRDTLRGGPGNDTLRGGGDRDLLDGGLGDDIVKSSDPVEAGFNDSSGLNADAIADSPYQIGGILFGHGSGEAGWAEGWQQVHGAVGSVTVQPDVAFEGDGAMHLQGPSTTAVRRLLASGVSAGVVTVSQMMYIPAGGGIVQYLTDPSVPDIAVATAAQWGAGAGGDFQIVDGGTWEGTGIRVPVQEWFRVDVQVDMTARTFAFFVNGLKYQSPDPLDFRGDPGALGNIEYFVEGTTGGYIDALQVDGAEALTPAIKGDTLRGGAGNDTLRGGGFPDLLQGGAGDDSLAGGGGNDNLQGGTGRDELAGDSGNDLMNGGAADDTLDGGDGNDTLTGVAGADHLLGGRGVDSLDGGVGDDSLDGGAGNDTVRGNKGSDTLLGGSGADLLTDAAGDDRLNGGGGPDRLDGGPGDDVVESGDPPPPDAVRGGFNDAEGMNADAAAGSPYANDTDLHQAGGGEPGWATPWFQTTGASVNARTQNAVVFEGDQALRIHGGTTGVARHWADPVASGVVTISQMIYANAGGGLTSYIHDTAGGPVEVVTAAQWGVGAGGTFGVVDRGTWEDTGIPFPVGQWVRVDVAVDMTNRTYDFFVNGGRYVAPDPIEFRGNPAVAGRVVYLVENFEGVFIDAVQVFGPNPGGDPATFGDTLAGGAGNDTVRGGQGDDLLAGSTGNDVLDGGAGRDLLIGGRGADGLIGGAGEDLLVGGYTAYDTHPFALPSISAEWTSTGPPVGRFANVTGTGVGPRLNGSYFLKPGKVYADASPDTLTGGADLDGFFFRTSEDTTDLTGDEFSVAL